jgi:hypothetical protein
MCVLNGGECKKMKDSCSERAAQMVRCHRLARGVRTYVREDVAVRHETGAADDAAVCKRAGATQLRDRRFTGKSINRFNNTVRALFCGGLVIQPSQNNALLDDAGYQLQWALGSA